VFDPFADETSFLLGAFIFEDVGVTAYKGAARLIANKDILEAAAGILAVEAYHAGTVRTSLYGKGLQAEVQKLSDARDSLDSKKPLDQGIGDTTTANLVPTDKNGIAFSRSPGQVLNIVYLNPKSVKKGGFFPKGVNGSVNQSGGKAEGLQPLLETHPQPARVVGIGLGHELERAVVLVDEFLVFFGGMSWHISSALLAHLFSFNIEWTSTAKELEAAGFFVSMDRVIKNFKWMLLAMIPVIAGMIYLAEGAPRGWRIEDYTSIVPLANQVGAHVLLPVMPIVLGS